MSRITVLGGTGYAGSAVVREAAARGHEVTAFSRTLPAEQVVGVTYVQGDAVDEADLVTQHSPLMSPLVWDLAHVGSQEELWLVRDVSCREPLRPEIDGLYDAFQHSRAKRVELPLLTPAEARTYAAEVRAKALDALAASPLRGRRLVEQGFAFGMIVQHEQQHDETMLATHQLRSGAPVLHAPPPPAPASSREGAAPAATEVLMAHPPRRAPAPLYGDGIGRVRA